MAVAGDGGVFSFGAAQLLGSMSGKRLDGAVVGITSFPGGGGYWLVAADGGVFSLGRLRRLVGRLVSPASVIVLFTANGGQGYTLVTTDGTATVF